MAEKARLIHYCSSMHGVPEELPDDYIDETNACECCPKGRSGHRIVVTDNELYSLGGFNPVLVEVFESEEYTSRGHPMLRELWRLNLSTLRWQLWDDHYCVPSSVASHTIVGRWLFLFGGTSIPFGEIPSNTMYRYNLSIRPRGHLGPREELDPDEMERGTLMYREPHISKWQEISTRGNRPYGRYGHSMTMNYPDAYIVGGTSGFVYNSDVYHLNLSGPTATWNQLSSDEDPCQPVGRYRHETAFDGRLLYVFGGGTATDAFSLVMVHTFDVVSKQWKSLKTVPDVNHGHPASRKCHSCCQYGDAVFLAGGLSGLSPQGFSKGLDDVWKFSLQNLAWTKLGVTLVQPTYFHSAAISEASGRMFIFGGVVPHQRTMLRTRQLSYIRIGVGQLLELSWEVVSSRLRHHSGNIDLCDLGIPRSLQARLGS